MTKFTSIVVLVVFAIMVGGCSQAPDQAKPQHSYTVVYSAHQVCMTVPKHDGVSSEGCAHTPLINPMMLHDKTDTGWQLSGVLPKGMTQIIVAGRPVSAPDGTFSVPVPSKFIVQWGTHTQKIGYAHSNNR